MLFGTKKENQIENPLPGMPDVKPDETVYFSVQEDGNLCILEKLPKKGSIILYAYDLSAEQYCCRRGVEINSDIITVEDLQELMMQVEEFDETAKIRICLYTEKGNDSFWLKLEGPHPDGIIGACFHLAPLVDDVVRSDTFCTGLTHHSRLCIRRLERIISFNESPVRISADRFQYSSLINLKGIDDFPAGTSVTFGLFDKIGEQFVFLNGQKSEINIRNIAFMYRHTLDFFEAKYPLGCLIIWSKNPEIALLELESFQPTDLVNLYDSLLLQMAVNQASDLTVCVNKRGNILVKEALSSDRNKYHYFTERNRLPEWADPEAFQIIDTEDFDNNAEEFFGLVHTYYQVIKEQDHYLASDIFFLKKRLITNLSAMMQSAHSLPTPYEKNHPDLTAEWAEFKQLLLLIEDDLIINSNMGRYDRWFLFGMKYNNDYQIREEEESVHLFFGETNMGYPGNFIMRLDIMDIRDGHLLIEGYYQCPDAIAQSDPQLCVFLDEEPISYQPVQRDNETLIFGKLCYKGLAFKLELPLPRHGAARITFGVELQGELYSCHALAYGALTPVSSELKNGYYYKDGYLLNANKSRILLRKSSEKGFQNSEIKLRAEIEEKEPEHAGEIIALRNYYWKHYRKEEKQRWLLIDRPDRADDNAEALFKYVTTELSDRVDATFVIRQDSEDFARMSQYGRVVDFCSEGHLRAFLSSDYVISSHMSASSINPFNEDSVYFRDLIRRRKFVFLQHGITSNDNGYGFSRYLRDYDGIIASAERERDYFLSPHLHNLPETIWLTGMPRFDYLRDEQKKVITIMPTWRKYLTHRVFDEELKAMIWAPSDQFKESDYYQLYNSLINHPKLIEAARENGYQISLMLHPQFLRLGYLFENRNPDILKICQYERKYQDVYAESALILTDFSSAVFDFAYLRKPVMYCQFDKDVFFHGHTLRPGYFEFERDGFGEVTYTLEEAVETLVGYIQNDCRLKETYRKRIDDFFAFSDRKCCERICKKILDEEEAGS